MLCLLFLYLLHSVKQIPSYVLSPSELYLIHPSYESKYILSSLQHYKRNTINVLNWFFKTYHICSTRSLEMIPTTELLTVTTLFVLVKKILWRWHVVTRGFFWNAVFFYDFNRLLLWPGSPVKWEVSSLDIGIPLYEALLAGFWFISQQRNIVDISKINRVRCRAWARVC